jgi:hypothetical protein
VNDTKSAIGVDLEYYPEPSGSGPKRRSSYRTTAVNIAEGIDAERIGILPIEATCERVENHGSAADDFVNVSEARENGGSGTEKTAAGTHYRNP